MSFEIVKAGYMYRKTSILKRWKKNWFVLYRDGHLRYFETPECHVAEGYIRMQADVLAIQVGKEIGDTGPPPGFVQECLIKVVARNDKTVIACAESPDDMSAWRMTLEESRILNTQRQGLQQSVVQPSRSGSAPPPYSETVVTQVYPQQAGVPYPQQTVPGMSYPQQHAAVAYPGQVYYGSHPQQYVVQNPGQPNVVYVQDPNYRRGYDGGDVAMGMVAGAALGSMMFAPMWLW